MRTRGLVVIYDPHALMQFLQFYCMEDYEAEWDVLCLPKEDGKEEMSLYCEQTGIFKKIYKGESEYKNLPILKKIKLFVPMVLSSITGRRKNYCKKTLNQYVGNIDRYEILVANTEMGFISGMLASFGKEKTVVYFEDGSGDYMFYRKRWKSIYPIKSFDNFQSIFMARLGYFGKGYTYLKPTRDAVKYCSVIEELLYRNYKEIRQFSMDNVMQKKFTELLDKIYPQLSSLTIDEQTAIAFTDPVEFDCEDWKGYVDEFIKEICKRHTKVMLKCHPREDVSKYSFPENVKLEIVPRDIPAEVILPYLNKNDCYFMFPNSILVNIKLYDVKICVLYSEDIYKQINKKYFFFNDIDGVRAFCERFIKDKYTVKSI